jgi:hypothetical protein
MAHHFLVAGPADRDDPDSVFSVRNDRRPMLASDHPDHQEPGLVLSTSRDLDEHLVEPESLGFDEVDAVLGFVALALGFIELELHSTSEGHNGMESIPLWARRPATGRSSSVRPAMGRESAIFVAISHA